jgi:hypothetical protein
LEEDNVKNRLTRRESPLMGLIFIIFAYYVNSDLTTPSKYPCQTLRKFPTHYIRPVMEYLYHAILQIIDAVWCPPYSHAIPILSTQPFHDCHPRLLDRDFQPTSMTCPQ